MKRILILMFSAKLSACSPGSTASQGCNPDTTVHSGYSFVDNQGNFIDNNLILRMYDASNNLGGYKVLTTDSCISFNKLKLISEMFRQLRTTDPALSQRLLKGEINACDTTSNGNHRLIPFIPIVYDTLRKML